MVQYINGDNCPRIFLSPWNVKKVMKLVVFILEPSDQFKKLSYVIKSFDINWISCDSGHA